MTSIRTEFTELLGITTPVVSPPMAYASGGALAAQVTLGGGFGFIGVGTEPVRKVQQELETARSVLSIKDGSPLPIGVGFLGWILDKQGEPLSKELISLLFEYRVKAVWLSFGDNLASYIQYIRDQQSPTATQQHGGHRILIFVQVSSLSEAQKAINEWKVDVVVAQGVEAGGHGASHGLPLLTFLPLILSNTAPSNRPPILAAGGIANGSQMAGLLTLGAAAVVVGTRFLLSPESLYSDTQRKIILSATSSQSVRSMAFDEARGTLGWPRGIDGRGIRNATYDDYESGVEPYIVRQRFDDASARGETDRLTVWAGTGVGLINSMLPAKDIVKELREECLSHLTDARNLLT